jgi:hypothetical protein
MVAHLPSKHEALNSNPRTAKKKKEIQKQKLKNGLEGRINLSFNILCRGGAVQISPHPHSYWIWHLSQKIGFHALEPAVGGEVRRRELVKGSSKVL